MADETTTKPEEYGENQYRFLAEYMVDVVWTMNPSGQFTYVSPSVKQLRGFTPEEVLAQSPAEALTPASLKVMQDSMMAVMPEIEKGESNFHLEPKTYELEQPCKDGSTVWTEVLVRVLFDEKGAFCGFLGVSRNIDERVRLETALRESEAKYQNLFMNMSEGAALHELIYDTDGNPVDYVIIEINPSFEKNLGISQVNVIGKASRQAYGVDEPPYFDIYTRVALTGEPTHFETYFQPLGKHFSISAYAPSHGRFATIFEDISERKRVETALQESMTLYKDLYENAPEMYLSVDPQTGLILQCNNTTVVKTGFEKSEIIGRHVYELYDPGCLETAGRAMQQFIKTGEAHDFELQVRKKDGVLIDVILNVTALRDSTGKILQSRSSWNDITDRKAAENVIRKLNETLEDRVAERTHQLESTNKELAFHLKETEQFTYIATHDLQEPLHTLTNFTGLLMEEYSGKLDEDGEKYIEFIHNSATRMSDLVKGLLEYSLLGKQSEIATVDCNKIVEEVIADMADAMNNCGAIITPSKLPVLRGFPTELRLLFQNLMINAIKFRKKGIQPLIDISAEMCGREWIFTIKDNGIGIDEKDKEKIFIIFKRMHNRNDYEGTGIGLAHCKKIIELHGGRIWVESVEGAGSSFRFTIPVTG